MSTVTKEIADQVIAGKFNEDPVIAIVEYENIFNGALAYKLIYKGQSIQGVKNSIACRGNRMYWTQEDGRK